ncbi:MAG: hypothetical protein HYR91_06040 [Flavobacteriia bacterium]|nr:hypothetical protein [Flavobacteriia bacterium]
MEKDTNKDLLAEIANLKKELDDLKMLSHPFKADGKTVKVPSEIQPLFDKAEDLVAEYFDKIIANPSNGKIEIGDERYVLMRASSLSVDFMNRMKVLYENKGEKMAASIGRNFLFDISHVMGGEDAKNFHKKMKVEDPIAKLSAGPIHFAYTGWAFVDILPESNPSPDDNYFLKYHHPYSFESESWISKSMKSDTPVCIMNAGYSSGWCEESFGIPLTAVEISCRAKGDANCTFIMAPPHRIEEYLIGESIDNKSYLKEEIPTFFERKKEEEKLFRMLKEKDEVINEINERIEYEMKIITELMNFQYLHSSTEEQTKEKLKQGVLRTKIVMLAREKNNVAKDNKRIALANYFKSIIKLADELFSKSTPITVEVNGFEVSHFPVDKAILSGLMIYEIILNLKKEMINSDDSADIHIAFEDSNEGYQISITDTNKTDLNNLFTTSNEENILSHSIINFLKEMLKATITNNLNGEVRIVYE